MDMVVAAIPWLPRAQRRQAAISAKTVTVKATAVSRVLPRSRIVTSRIREGRRSRPDYNVNANVRGRRRFSRKSYLGIRSRTPLSGFGSMHFDGGVDDLEAGRH